MAKFTRLVKRFSRKKRKTIAMYLFRRRGWGTTVSTPGTTPEVELQAENGDYLFSEAGSYLIKE
jgi:hypothetical protein